MNVSQWMLRFHSFFSIWGNWNVQRVYCLTVCARFMNGHVHYSLHNLTVFHTCISAAAACNYHNILTGCLGFTLTSTVSRMWGCCCFTEGLISTGAAWPATGAAWPAKWLPPGFPPSPSLLHSRPPSPPPPPTETKSPKTSNDSNRFVSHALCFFLWK